MAEDFTFRDGERLIRFGAAALADAPGMLAGRGFDGYVLLTTERASATVPLLGELAEDVLHVPSGEVPEAAAAVRDSVRGRPIVALGGGRVVDAAKAIAAADDLSCAAIPTTLSGAELTSFHRMPAGVDAFRLVRPALVIAQPDLMASQPMPALAASALNAMAHAFEALYTPLANPVANMAALRGAGLIAQGLDSDTPDQEQLALGALLAGYAVGITGFAVHHAICQTIVRTAGTPHAQTYAVMLPYFVEMMTTKAPDAIGKFAVAIGASQQAMTAAARAAELSAKAGPRTLEAIGFDRALVDDVVAVAMTRGDIFSNTPNPPTEAELKQVIEEAL